MCVVIAISTSSLISRHVAVCNYVTNATKENRKKWELYRNHTLIQTQEQDYINEKLETTEERM